MKYENCRPAPSRALMSFSHRIIWNLKSRTFNTSHWDDGNLGKATHDSSRRRDGEREIMWKKTVQEFLSIEVFYRKLRRRRLLLRLVCCRRIVIN